jgi:hypothetical protein
MLQSSFGNFPGIFVIFRVFFRAFKTIFRISGIVFALKINSKKQNLSYPFGPSP